MTLQLIRGVFALLIVVPCAGCGLLRPRQKKLAAPSQPLLVGTVILVNADRRFVLIDSGTGSGPLPGAVLKCRAPTEETGEVKVGEVRRRPFAIADVMKGAPRTGDQVFQQPP